MPEVQSIGTRTIADRTGINANADIVNISGNIYAIVCPDDHSGIACKGLLTTLQIDADGTITEIDTYYYEGAVNGGEGASITHIAGDVYAITCAGSSAQGHVLTLSIAANGTITESIIDNYQFNTGSYYLDSATIRKIEGTNYCGILYRTSDDYLIFISVAIADNGTITKSVFDTLPIDTSNYEGFLHIGNGVFIIVHKALSGPTMIYTASIHTGTGAITGIDSSELVAAGYYPGITHIAGTTYAITDRGTLYTKAISAGGSIGATIDSYEFDSNGLGYGSIANINGSTYLLAYRGLSNYGYAIAIIISEAGVIGSASAACEFISAGASLIRSSTIAGSEYSAMIVYNKTTTSQSVLRVLGYVAEPTVTTQPVSDITPWAATGNGNITSLGTPSPTAHGVCWNTTGAPTTDDDTTDEGAASSMGAFESTFSGLTKYTTYYVKAYATNPAGTAYGGQVMFFTKSETIGVLCIKGTRLHYVDAEGTERYIEGTIAD
jgi:hypothetical protein